MKGWNLFHLKWKESGLQNQWAEEKRTEGNVLTSIVLGQSLYEHDCDRKEEAITPGEAEDRRKRRGRRTNHIEKSSYLCNELGDQYEHWMSRGFYKTFISDISLVLTT